MQQLNMINHIINLELYIKKHKKSRFNPAYYIHYPNKAKVKEKEAQVVSCNKILKASK